MAEEKKTDNLKRYRFSVPKNDDPVIHWLSVQANVSYSLRTLIRDSIARQGYVDITCGEPSSKSPGRPRKSQQDALERAAMGQLYAESNAVVQRAEQIAAEAQSEGDPILALVHEMAQNNMPLNVPPSVPPSGRIEGYPENEINSVPAQPVNTNMVNPTAVNSESDNSQFNYTGVQPQAQPAPQNTVNEQAVDDNDDDMAMFSFRNRR